METIPWSALAELDAGQLQTALLAIAEVRMEGLSDDAEAAAASALPQPVHVLWVLGWLDFEVAQGSLLAFFSNSHGRFAADAAKALRTIGALRMAAVLEEAMAAVAGASRESAPRQAVDEFAITFPYEVLLNAEKLVELTDRYEAAAEADDWGAKLDAFLAESVRRLATR